MQDMPDRPLVTHFVYAYRQEASVRAAVESVLAQTYEPLEVILSDDCSPDGTFAVMEAVAAAYRGPHRVVLNRNPTNLGIARHVERIMDLASGALVIESGGDDVSAPHRAARLVEAWLASGRRAHLVHSGRIDVDETGAALASRPGRTPLGTMAPVEMLRRERQALLGATAGWTPALYQRFGPISDLAAFHDYPLAFRALLLGGEIVYVDAPLVRYSRGGVTRQAAEGFGHWCLYGGRIRLLRWDLGFYRSYRRDLDRVEPPDAVACRALADAFIRQAELTLALAEAGPARALARLPEAAAASLRHRDPALARTALKYLCGPLSVRYLDRRHGGKGRRVSGGAVGGEPA